jgi:hypothetical protein
VRGANTRGGHGVPPLTNPATKPTVIAASTVLDGKGRVLRNVRIVIEGPKIVGVIQEAEKKQD